ncbi:MULTISPECIES: hypothetical protein [unclassified Microcoleus]|uniref:hypothetical protein n=1 Tax=unclassified Microcoleus TaxID=2642155 RepID=UPI002FD333B7
MILLDGASKERKFAGNHLLPGVQPGNKELFSGLAIAPAVDRIRAATSTTGRIFRSLVAYYFLNLVGLAQAMRDITLPVRPIF